MKERYTNFGEIPLMLNAKDIAKLLGMSQSNIYNLLRAEGVKIQGRLFLPKSKVEELISNKIN